MLQEAKVNAEKIVKVMKEEREEYRKMEQYHEEYAYDDWLIIKKDLKHFLQLKYAKKVNNYVRL